MDTRSKAVDDFDKWINNANADDNGNDTCNSETTPQQPSPNTSISSSDSQSSSRSPFLSPASSTSLSPPPLPPVPPPSTSYATRPKFMELDINDVEPSDIVKSVLAKKSIFDDDLKRLENIGEKYEPKEFSNLKSSVTNVNQMKINIASICNSQLNRMLSTPLPSTYTTQISTSTRVNASPMNSPQTQSPYSSPSPTTNVLAQRLSNSLSSMQPVKGLQYPFPSHPPLPPLPASTSTNPSSSVPSTPPGPAPGQLKDNTRDDEPNTKSKSHSSNNGNSSSSNSSSSASKLSNNTEKSAQSSHQSSKSSHGGSHRTLNKSASVPGSTNSGTVRAPLLTSCSLNSKDEHSEGGENSGHSRKLSNAREEKISTAKSDERHSSKKSELLDRRKWNESMSSDNAELNVETPTEKIEERNLFRDRHETNKPEQSKREKARGQLESVSESHEKDEHRSKRENADTKRPEDYEQRRRDNSTDEASNWKSETNRTQSNQRNEDGHRKNKERDNSANTNNHHSKSDKHNKENSSKSRESTPLDRAQVADDKTSEHKSRSNSPVKANTKRRLSSHESMDSDDGKRFKFSAQDNGKERRDFKDPNRVEKTSSKHHQRQSSTSKMNQLHKSHSVTETASESEERMKKEPTPDERKKERDGDKHRRSDKSHRNHKAKEEKMQKHPNEAEVQNAVVAAIEIRTNDEDAKVKAETNAKESKRTSEHHSSHRHHSNSHETKHRTDEKPKAEKRADREHSSQKRGGRCDETQNTSSKSSHERRSEKRKQISIQNSSNDSDSNELKKLENLADDGTPYISMYDKVKARSCKNSQKQEVEKKIKAKFSQLKQSRAKREEKNKSNSFDEDSDSDTEANDKRTKSANKMRHFFDSSTEDSDGHHSANKDAVSDSDTNQTNQRKPNYHMNRLNELCDGESSESSLGHPLPVQESKRRSTTRKTSRSARIATDTSDEASEPVKPAKIKDEPIEHPKSEKHSSKSDIKSTAMNVKDEKSECMQYKVKTEPIDDVYNFDGKMSSLGDLSDIDSITPSSKASETKDSIFDNSYNAELKKKHKKNKKRQKSPEHIDELKQIKPEDLKVEKTNSMESMFDELKREMPTAEKKRHNKKDKKRDRSSKEQCERVKEDKYRSRKLKKQSRLPSDASAFESQDSLQITKRNERLEDIFGPMSDDDSLNAPVDPHKASINKTVANVTQVTQPALLNASNNAPTANSKTIPNEMHRETISPVPHIEKDKHREKKREKKRKEREKQHHQHHSIKEEENSVDLDAAARALEARLMEDDDKVEVLNDFVFAESKENSKASPSEATQSESASSKTYDDVFRFSENEDAIDKELFNTHKSETMEAHRTKDKKKKKKRSREEKRHHHHHSSHSLFNSPPATPRLTIDTSDAEDSPLIKSTSLAENHSTTVDIPEPPPAECKPMEIKPDVSCNNSKSNDDKRKESKSSKSNFGKETEAKTAVQSIAKEFKPDTDADEGKKKKKSSASAEPKASEEKSRVVISQEETEDAVAALLGESFGGDYTECFGVETAAVESEPEASVSPPNNTNVIAEEEAEEMRKAVQSLNSEDLDMKPGTPPSENELQIDTDNEDQDDPTALRIDESVTSADAKPERTVTGTRSPRTGQTETVRTGRSPRPNRSPRANQSPRANRSPRASRSPRACTIAGKEKAHADSVIIASEKPAKQPEVIVSEEQPKAEPITPPNTAIILPPIIPQLSPAEIAASVPSVSITIPPQATLIKSPLPSPNDTNKPPITSKWHFFYTIFIPTHKTALFYGNIHFTTISACFFVLIRFDI